MPEFFGGENASFNTPGARALNAIEINSGGSTANPCVIFSKFPLFFF